MIVLDTNIVSELQKPHPDALVAAWLQAVPARDIYLCAPVVMEQAFGAERYFMRTGSNRYREVLRQTLRRFENRILDFDDDIPVLAGQLRARRDAHGQPISICDAMIAAICIAHGATLATRNIRDFAHLDLTLINPFEAQA